MDVTIPSPGESVTEVTISVWLKPDGARVRKNDELFEIESDKATLSVSSEVDGVLKILIPAGETAKVGTVAGRVEPVAGETVVTTPDSAPKAKGESAKSATPGKVDAVAEKIPSVAAKKLMVEKQIAPTEINGSGRGGRITKADVLDHLSSAPAPGLPASLASDASPAAVGAADARGERREPMSKLRLKVAERLVAAKNLTAMLTTFNEVDMTGVIAVRKQYKERFQEKFEINLGFMSFFTRATVEALKEFPAVNAFIDEDELVYHDYIDIGVAVQAPKGLVVPVLRNAETMSFDTIETEIDRLATRARTNQLTLDEMTGGTFTISNGGIFGNLMSTPILNPPQSAILGMHKIMDRPVAFNGEVVIRPMMYLALSYDHRIIDGRESVGFLKRIKDLVEDPIRLLLKV